MKFGDFINRKKKINNDIGDFYIDYDYLKKMINDHTNDYIFFLEMIKLEFKKINLFVNSARRNNMLTKDKLLDFILINYVGFYKIFKKYDKKRSQNKKLEFYELIREQDFYKHYQMRIPNNEIKLVVFDKDGTLIDNTLMFGTWTVQMVKNLHEIFPELLDDEKRKPTIWKHLGYDYINDVFDGDSIVAKGSNDDIRNAICDYIINIRNLVICKNEKDRKSIVQMIREIWFDIKVTNDTIKQCGDIHGVFNFLHMNNIKIAICTCDDRKPTEECLKILDISLKNKKMSLGENKKSTYIDDLICGNDMIANKPAPDPLLKICKNLKIKPENAMMVGDTISDVHAGINAKFGRVVGVLSGGYKNAKLNEADTIIPNIDGLIKIFPGSCYSKQK